jgi:zinc transport system substrate-binding protein
MKTASLVWAFLLVASSTFASAEIRVMASIKPIHSLVASVMQGAGSPGLIVAGNNSPHNYVLKPSDAKALQRADVIFWVDHSFEAFLEKPISSLGSKATVVALLNAAGVKTLAVRDGNGFDKQKDEGEHEHGDGEVDGHIWLDPENAKAIVQVVANVLAEKEPGNAKLYRDNAATTITRLNQLSKNIAADVTPLKGKGFIVFHDAYHYFEKRFGLSATGAISLHPESPPGAKGIAAIRQRVADGRVQCVFAEPQFDNAMVATVLEGTTVKSATLDPEGATLDPGPALYETVMRNLANNLKDCLS